MCIICSKAVIDPAGAAPAVCACDAAKTQGSSDQLACKTSSPVNQDVLPYHLQIVLGKHALHRLSQHRGGISLVLLLRRTLTQASGVPGQTSTRTTLRNRKLLAPTLLAESVKKPAGIPCVPIIDLLVPFLASESDLVSIDHDNYIAIFYPRRIGGLVLPLLQLTCCSFSGETFWRGHSENPVSDPDKFSARDSVLVVGRVGGQGTSTDLAPHPNNRSRHSLGNWLEKYTTGLRQGHLVSHVVRAASTCYGGERQGESVTGLRRAARRAPATAALVRSPSAGVPFACARAPEGRGRSEEWSPGARSSRALIARARPARGPSPAVDHHAPR
eukprot:scaffold223_cov408-Prasinococcus_capsulatus_cf.AAC.16